MDNNELKHHGVPGMKWGVRKDKSSSGSSDGLKKKIAKTKLKNELKKQKTEEANAKIKQKIERAKLKSELKNEKQKLKDAKPKSDKQLDDAVKKRKQDLRERRTLSDDELQKKINRLEMEKRFKELSNDDVAPGKKAIKEVLSASGKRVATTVAYGGMLYGIKVAITRKFNAKDFADYVAPKPKNK